MQIEVKNLELESVGNVDLSKDVFQKEVKKNILHRVIEWQRAKARSGNHKTKVISEISGTTKKPHAQKGTGRARQGSLRSPQFRGGAAIFGPVKRSHEHSLPKKVRRLGLSMALSSKLASENLIIVESFQLKEFKTKAVSQVVNKLGGSILFIDSDLYNQQFKIAARNIVGVHFLPSIGANVLDIIKYKKLVMSKAGLEELEKRLSNA